MQKLSNKIIYCWICDFSSKSGEGNLARLFIKKQIKRKKIISPKIILKKKTIFNHKYVLPFLGLIFCWYYFFKNKKVAYINYLPLWNFIIFLLLPPNSILGPITGGAHFSKGDGYIIRKYIFPFFYKISEIIILLRYEKPIFATNLLEKYLYKKTINKSIFNFVFNHVRKREKVKKKIDFLIYYKNHKNKKKLYNFNIIKKLIKLKFKIYVVGDKMEGSKFINLGFIKKTKLNYLLDRTKYSIVSEENIFSLYTLDCINSNVKIVITKKNKIKINKFSENFIFVKSHLKDLRNKLR